MRDWKKTGKTALLAVAAVAVAIAGWFYLSDSKESNQPSPKKPKLTVRANREKPKRPTIKKSKSAKRGEKPVFDFDSAEHPYSAADKKLARSLQEALDVDDYDAVLKATSEALKSNNPDVRHNAVDALGWYGEQALPELTVCMADPDEDVAQAAMNHWEEGVAEMEDANEKLQVALYAINTLTDADTLSIVSSHFAQAATELIDSEEDEAAASQKRVEVIQALVDTIEGEGEKGANAAREAYEEITGSEWISIDEAEKYLADPDNYEAPEKTAPEQNDQGQNAEGQGQNAGGQGQNTDGEGQNAEAQQQTSGETM